MDRDKKGSFSVIPKPMELKNGMAPEYVKKEPEELPNAILKFGLIGKDRNSDKI